MAERIVNLQIIVSGEVQGVSFRYWTKKQAQKYNLTGFVKNLPNGTVEMKIQGKESNIDEFLKVLHTTGGPPLAQIQSVKTNTISDKLTYTSFEIKKNN